LIANPSKYRKSNAYSAARYVKNLVFDKDTGEIQHTGRELLIDEDKIKEEEKYDGYYAIVTSECDETDDNIIRAYRGLWKIEESFRITKNTLEARPAYLSREDHINANFLVNFLTITIGRLLEIRLRHKYPMVRILEALRSVNCSHLDQNIYLFDYRNEITDELNKVFELNIGVKFMTLDDIKSSLAQTKKS
jgi:transposase